MLEYIPTVVQVIPYEDYTVDPGYRIWARWR